MKQTWYKGFSIRRIHQLILSLAYRKIPQNPAKTQMTRPGHPEIIQEVQSENPII